MSTLDELKALRLQAGTAHAGGYTYRLLDILIRDCESYEADGGCVDVQGVVEKCQVLSADVERLTKDLELSQEARTNLVAELMETTLERNELRKALAAEREDCAKVCETCPDSLYGPWCAARIRARTP